MLEILGGRPQEITTFEENFPSTYQNFWTFQYFRNKVTEIREEIRVWGWVGLMHLNPPPSQKFVMAPLAQSLNGLSQI